MTGQAGAIGALPQGARAAAPPARPVVQEHVRARPRWARTYLLFSILLVPLVQPAGPQQTALLDILNVIAMGFFAIHVLTERRNVRFPFVPAILLITVGSLLALMDAESVWQGVLTLTQEAYLFLWFVMLVDLLSDADELRRARVIWMGAALLAAVASLIMLELQSPGALSHIASPKGLRAAGTFTNPNMLADYMALSILLVMSLGGSVPGVIRWGAIGLLLIALVATKSNGGVLTLAIGGFVWITARLLTRRMPSAAPVGALLTVIGAAALGLWLVASVGGGHDLRKLSEGSFLSRASHSSESRAAIWLELVKRYPAHPLGIGPGNSKHQKLPIGSRQRPDSFLGKTAHNDYVGYLVERGPLGLAGLLLLVVQAFLAVVVAWRAARDPVWAAGEGGAVLATLVAILVATSFHSIIIEKLHFRHFWFLLAMMAAFQAPRRQAPLAVRT